MAYVISISNIKGGVAKTSTAVSLASSFAQAGYRVLVIDLDTQADLTWGLGLPAESVRMVAKDLFISGSSRRTRLSSFILKTKYNNLDIIPSSGEINWNEPGLSNQYGLETRLKEAFRAEPDLPYDFIVIDCPLSMGIYTVSAILASNLLLIPTQAEYFSANSLKRMMSVFQILRQKGNPTLEYRVLVTMLDLRNRIQRQVLEEFRKGFKENLFATPIEIDTKIRESQSLRVPIIHSFPEARSSLQYQKLSKEILDFRPEVRPMQPPPVTEPARETVVTKRVHAHCPFLGMKADTTTALAFPSKLNRCYRAKPDATPKMDYQHARCLTRNYVGCVLLNEKSEGFMPAHLQEPPQSIWSKLGFG